MRSRIGITTLLAAIAMPVALRAQSSEAPTSSPAPTSSESPAPSPEVPTASAGPPAGEASPPPIETTPSEPSTASHAPPTVASSTPIFHAVDPESDTNVIGPSSESLARMPGSATVVTDRDIARLVPFTTGEVLRRIPGLYVREGDNVGIGLHLGVRGLDPTGSRNVLVLEDGIPIALNPYGYPESPYMPPIERVVRIESLRGSASVLFGPQTMGGVINFVTAAPPLHETYSLRAVAGDYGLPHGAQASYGNTFGNVGMMVTVLRRQGDGFRQNPWEVTDALAKFRLELGPRSVVLVRFGFTEQGLNPVSTGLTTAMFEQDPRQNPSRFDWNRLQRISSSLTYDYRIADDIRLRTLLYGYVTEDHSFRQLVDREAIDGLAYARIAGDPTQPGAALFFRDANRIDNRAFQVFGIEPRVQAGFRIGGFRNELDIGGRLLLERAQTQTAYGTAQYARIGDAEHAELAEGYGVGAHLQDRFFITDSLIAAGIIRVENNNFSRLIRRSEYTDVFTRAQNSTLLLIPGATVSYTFPWVTAFTGVHLGYSPSRVDQAVDPYNPSFVVVPEQSINYEVGLRTNVASWIRAEAAGFFLDVQNPLAYGTRTNGTIGWYNGDHLRNVGAEAFAQVEFGRLLHVDTNIYVSARYTFVDARYASGPFSGNYVPYAPPHTVVASAGLEHPIGLALNVSWMFVASQATDAANTAMASIDGRLGPLPAYNALDATASYTHHPTGLGVSFSVKNALDMPYIASRSPDGIMPSGFRQFVLALRWDR